MEVGRSRIAGVGPQLVLAPDRVRERVRPPQAPVRAAEQQLRRIAVTEALRADVDTVVEDREVGAPVVVEVCRERNRIARVDRPFDQLGCVCQAAVARCNEHAQRRLRESFLGRRVALVLIEPAREDIVAPVAVEVRNGEHEVEPAQAGLGDDAGEGL